MKQRMTTVFAVAITTAASLANAARSSAAAAVAVPELVPKEVTIGFHKVTIAVEAVEPSGTAAAVLNAVEAQLKGDLDESEASARELAEDARSLQAKLDAITIVARVHARRAWGIDDEQLAKTHHEQAAIAFEQAAGLARALSHERAFVISMNRLISASQHWKLAGQPHRGLVLLEAVTDEHWHRLREEREQFAMIEALRIDLYEAIGDAREARILRHGASRRRNPLIKPEEDWIMWELSSIRDEFAGDVMHGMERPDHAMNASAIDEVLMRYDDASTATIAHAMGHRAHAAKGAKLDPTLTLGLFEQTARFILDHRDSWAPDSRKKASTEITLTSCLQVLATPRHPDLDVALWAATMLPDRGAARDRDHWGRTIQAIKRQMDRRRGKPVIRAPF